MDGGIIKMWAMPWDCCIYRDGLVRVVTQGSGHRAVQATGTRRGRPRRILLLLAVRHAAHTLMRVTHMACLYHSQRQKHTALVVAHCALPLWQQAQLP